MARVLVFFLVSLVDLARWKGCLGESEASMSKKLPMTPMAMGALTGISSKDAPLWIKHAVARRAVSEQVKMDRQTDRQTTPFPDIAVAPETITEFISDT